MLHRPDPARILVYPVRFPFPPAPRPDASRVVREAACWLLDSAPGLPSMIKRVHRRGRRPRVAVTVGSRGLGELPCLVSILVGALQQRGCRAFILPAMGNHGGGSPEGRREVLRGLGVTPEAVSAPILDEPHTVLVGHTPAGRPVYCHPAALAADGVILLNRVKPHPSFKGRIQSGLLKMLAVGLGGPAGAAEVHRRGALGLEGSIEDLSRALLALLGDKAAGLGLVEGPSGAMAALLPSGPGASLPATDHCLLSLARRLVPTPPYDELDLLLVDYVGKDIAGPGLDPLITGRRGVWDYPEPARPRVGRLVALRLTPASAGNANGIGLADFTTERLARSINWPKTMANALTSTFTRRAALPPVLPTDSAALEAALATLSGRPQPHPARGGHREKPDIRLMRIRDTLHLEPCYVSGPLLKEFPEVLGPPEPLPFGRDGNLTDLDES